MSTLRPSLRTQSSQAEPKPNVVMISQNIMELLVIEEVHKQIQLLPVKTAKYIQVPDVVAYALNRLPSLYATSKRGWQRQVHRAKTEYSQQIHQGVHQGIIAVQRDPLRVSDLLNQPLENEEMNQAANAALEKLKVVLKRGDLSWENLVNVVEQSLQQSAVSTQQSHSPGNNYGRPRHSTDHWETYRY
jgi:Late competence development protein ComFB